MTLFIGLLFKARGQLRKLEEVTSVLLNDTRPLKSVLAGWGGSELYRFDEFFTTVGFFLPEGRVLRLAELQSIRPGADFNASPVRIFGSRNNQQWMEYTGEFQLKVIHKESSDVLIISGKPEDNRYWKIHFGSSSRDGKFIFNSGGSLKVFGLSAVGN